MKKIYFVKVDKNNFYLSFEIGNQYDTWGSGTLRLESIPEFDENKYYKYENNNWVEYDVYPIIEESIEVPQTITKLQAMKQLQKIEKWTQLKAILADPANEDINDEWILSNELNRSYPLVSQMAIVLNLTEDEVDNLFIEASKL